MVVTKRSIFRPSFRSPFLGDSSGRLILLLYLLLRFPLVLRSFYLSWLYYSQRIFVYFQLYLFRGSPPLSIYIYLGCFSESEADFF